MTAAIVVLVLYFAGLAWWHRWGMREIQRIERRAGVSE